MISLKKTSTLSLESNTLVSYEVHEPLYDRSSQADVLNTTFNFQAWGPTHCSHLNCI